MIDALDILRTLTGAIWLFLLFKLAKPAWRAANAKPDLRPTEAVMGAVWLLCLNRETFTLVAWSMPENRAAVAFCYGFALIGGLNMVHACAWARRKARL